MKTLLVARSRILHNFVRRMASDAMQLVEENFDYIRKYLSQFTGGKITLDRDIDNGIATLMLDNPGKKNAISGAMMIDLRDSVEQLEQWQEGKAVIICGNGGNFCSGGDLDLAKASGTAEEAMRIGTWMHDTLRRLQRLPLVSVCLIEGPSLGGGAEVSTFCDFIVAAENVKYGFVHGRLGITTAWCGGTGLTKKVGPKKALDLLLTSKILGAKECLELGLADAIVPANDALKNAKEWLMPRIRHHHTVTRAFKDITHRQQWDSYENCFKYERRRSAPFWGGELNRAALAKNIKHVKE